ncbi:3767_t:CDS:2, partial [Ambispora leptoticha]
MSDPIDQLFDSHIIHNQSYDLLITMFLRSIFLDIHKLYLVFLSTLSSDKDTYTFLENCSSSLEDFIFFLYERDNKKAFSLFSRTINRTIRVASVLNWDGYGKDNITLDYLNSGLNKLSFNDTSS